MTLTVTSVFGPAWIQDLGRPGHMHEGMPWGGALVPELAMAANIAVGNPVSAPVIEFFGSLGVRSTRPLAQDGHVVDAQRGANLRPPPGRRVSYLAVAGGFDVPLCMGGFGTFPAGGLGGFEGRTLGAEDVIPLRATDAAPGAFPGAARGRLAAPDFDAALPVYPGPDRALFDDADWARFLGARWQLIEPSDRSGTRLRGPVLQPRARADSASAPMVPGAVQVPPDGQPIVLGPDHPVTGGYPVIAVVARAALGSLQGRVMGAAVQFAPAEDSQPAR